MVHFVVDDLYASLPVGLQDELLSLTEEDIASLPHYLVTGQVVPGKGEERCRELDVVFQVAFLKM